MYSLMVVLSLLLSADVPARLRVPPARVPAAVRRAAGGDPLHPQLGHVRRRRHRWSRSCRCSWRRERPPRACCATPSSATAPRSCSTCRGCRRCSSRPPTPGRRGSTRRASDAPIQIAKGLLGGGTVTVALLLGGGLRPRRGAHAEARERQGTHGDAHRAVDRRRDARGRLAVLAGLAGVDHALPRRRRSGPLFLLAAVGLARAGDLGLVRSGDRAGHLVDPADQQPRDQEQRRGPRAAQWPRT